MPATIAAHYLINEIPNNQAGKISSNITFVYNDY